MGRKFFDFTHACDWAEDQLKHYGDSVDTGTWQGIPTEGRPDLMTKEILDLDFSVSLPTRSNEPGWLDRLAEDIKPNRAWADEHFSERIGGTPMNPDPSHERWPWWKGQSKETQTDGQFTHTYSERFWPKNADGPLPGALRGIRFPYGDYQDVLDLLTREPYTRQAYLPIFFPEDTGAVHRGRIPCSLGYHFLLRDRRLHCWYDIRSCDAVRHFRDDLYLAARLMEHTVATLIEMELMGREMKKLWIDVEPGTLYFKCHSFHVHMGDYHRL